MSIIKQPKDATTQTFLIDTFFKNRPSLGIIIQDAGNNQFAFEALHQTHLYLSQTNKVELAFFSQEWAKSSVVPPTAVYHIMDLYGYTGDILSSSFHGILDALRIKTVQQKIWYIYDSTEIQMYNPDFIKEILNNNEIIKIFRDNTYRIMLEKLFEQSIDVIDPMIDFNLPRIIEILYGKKYAIGIKTAKM